MVVNERPPGVSSLQCVLGRDWNWTKSGICIIFNHVFGWRGGGGVGHPSGFWGS